MADVLVDPRTTQDGEIMAVWLTDGSCMHITTRFIYETVVMDDGSKAEVVRGKQLFTDSGDECFCNFQDGLISSILIPWHTGQGRKEFRQAKFRLDG